MDPFDGFDDNEEPELPDDETWDFANEESWVSLSADLLRDVLDSAEIDESTAEIVIKGRTIDNQDFSERFRSLEELRSFLSSYGFDP
jgi:hypothetical protein